MAHVGYARVSSAEQSLARQLDDAELAKEGIKLNKLFVEKLSGKDMNRPELEKCLNYCREGDTLYVHSIDRLARNLTDLQKIVDSLTKKDVTVVFFKEKLTFTKNEINPLNTLMFQMLGAFAQFERSLIESRRREGIAKAKAEGKYKGKQSLLTTWDYDKMKQMRADGVPVAEIARQYKMTPQGVYKALKRAEAQTA